MGFRYLAAQWTHSIFDDFIIKQLPPIVTWVLSFAYVIRLAKVKDIYSDNGGQVSRMHTVLPSYRPTVLPSPRTALLFTVLLLVLYKPCHGLPPRKVLCSAHWTLVVLPVPVPAYPHAVSYPTRQHSRP